jgi:hypothetical protein
LPKLQLANRPFRLTTAVRLGLSAGLVLAAWLLATCGAPGVPASETGADTAVLVDYHRTGGIAGLGDHLVVRTDGTASLQRKGEAEVNFTLDPQTRADLEQTLAARDFVALAGSHEPGRAIPDAFHYKVTYAGAGGRHTVETSDGAIPNDLAPVLDVLNKIISQH